MVSIERFGMWKFRRQVAVDIRCRKVHRHLAPRGEHRERNYYGPSSNAPTGSAKMSVRDRSGFAGMARASNDVCNNCHDKQSACRESDSINEPAGLNERPAHGPEQE